MEKEYDIANHSIDFALGVRLDLFFGGTCFTDECKRIIST